ncbi:hypothetical protein F5X96DRAFT_146392 [Biscogniauxia mediterranea]|nr:hypothetical protein F5X96DRAFT_146392 [Biscogniauxia mediterranea]
MTGKESSHAAKPIMSATCCNGMMGSTYVWYTVVVVRCRWCGSGIDYLLFLCAWWLVVGLCMTGPANYPIPTYLEAKMEKGMFVVVRFLNYNTDIHGDPTQQGPTTPTLLAGQGAGEGRRLTLTSCCCSNHIYHLFKTYLLFCRPSFSKSGPR